MTLFQKIKDILFAKSEHDKFFEEYTEYMKDIAKNSAQTDKIIEEIQLMLKKIKTKEKQMANTTIQNIIEPDSLPKPVDISEINIEVPEMMIQQAAGSIGGVNNFVRLLQTANLYREANLTPIYLTNASQTALRVVAREFLENPYIIN